MMKTCFLNPFIFSYGGQPTQCVFMQLCLFHFIHLSVCWGYLPVSQSPPPSRLLLKHMNHPLSQHRPDHYLLEEA